MAALATAACATSQASPEANVDVPSSDAAWVASACEPASVDTAGWERHRLGNLTYAAPTEYRGGSYDPNYSGVRGPGGTVYLYLHRNARYTFDEANRGGRRGQNWCQGTLGGYSAEILSWFEPFGRGASYNFVARVKATWGGQDEGKWLYARVSASRLRDAYRLRDALHTLHAVPDSSR